MISRRILAMTALAVAGLAAAAGAVPAGATARAGAAPLADHVVILSLPAVTWSDVQRQLNDGSRPRGLARLLKGAAVGNVSLRSVLRHTSLGEGYATIGAGTRTAGASLADGLAFDSDESFQGTPARDVWSRRLGARADSGGGEIVVPSFGPILARNRGLRFGSVPGAFGRALRDAGVTTAVIANADTSATDPAAASYTRTAALAVADTSGTVESGEVARSLLVTDPAAPFGVTLDPGAVVAALRRAWGPRTVALVEASDLVRADAERVLTAPAARQRLVDGALDRTATLAGALLDAGLFDPARDAFMIVTPAHSTMAVHLGVFAAHIPGARASEVRSPSTRRTGVVMLPDLAPTVLAWMGVARPDSMEGRAIEVVGRRRALAQHIAELVRTDRDAGARDRLVAPVTAIFIVLQALVALAAVVLLGRRAGPGTPRAGQRAVEVVGLALFGYLAAVYVAVPLHLAHRGAAAYLGFLMLFGVAAAVAAIAAGRVSPLAPPAILLTGLALLLAADLVTGGRLQFNAVLGYSPTVGGRFAGAGNLTFAQLSACAILLAGLAAHVSRGRARWAWAPVAILCVALVVDGLPLWGADVGGVLSLVPAGAVTIFALRGWRLRPRLLAALAGAAFLAVALAAGIDMLRPADHRTHLGRLVEQIHRDGLSALTRVVERKAGANLAVLTTSVWTLLVPIVLLFIAYLIYRAPGRLRMISERVPELRASLSGVFVLAILGYSLNDSGIAVPALMLGVLNPVLVFLAARWT